MKLSEVLNILDTLFQVSYTVHLDVQQSVERNLSVDVRFSVHEARVSVSCGDSPVGCLVSLDALHLASGQDLPFSSVSNIKGNLADNAILTLAVISAIEEQDAR